jgi:esterase/lipase superfamily enzyme
VLTQIGLPDYHSYGTRIADLRNLAAATRLTVEARRQGLSGEALARFIAQAPEDMRDVFSRQAFAYNPQSRELTIVLREKSPVLGDPGEYRLPL